MNEWRCYLFGLAESNFSSEKSPAVSLIPSCRLLPVGLMDPRRDRKEACVCVCVFVFVRVAESVVRVAFFTRASQP